MAVEIGNIFEDNKANVRSVNPNTLIASTFTDPHDRPSFIIESNKRRHSSSVHSITSNLEKMAHVCTQQEELTGLVATLTALLYAEHCFPLLQNASYGCELLRLC